VQNVVWQKSSSVDRSRWGSPMLFGKIGGITFAKQYSNSDTGGEFFLNSCQTICAAGMIRYDFS
jgi:hypothetical protein